MHQIPTDSGILNCLKAVLFMRLLNKKYIAFFARKYYSNKYNNGLENINIVIEKKEDKK